MNRASATISAVVTTAVLVAVAWSSAQAISTTIDAPERVFVAKTDRVQPAVPERVEMKSLRQDEAVIEQNPVEQTPGDAPAEAPTNEAAPPQYEEAPVTEEKTPVEQAPVVEVTTGDSPQAEQAGPTDADRVPPPYVEPDPSEIMDPTE